MSEFTEVMRQARRMCKTKEDCESCPLWDTAKFFCKIDNTTCYSDSDDSAIENIVMQWAAEHPETVYPTWREWQRAVFPDVTSRIQPCMFLSKQKLGCANSTCLVCASKPIPADIAEKLGIRPKEA